MKHLYKYLQQAFPYQQLLAENQQRGLNQREFELIDTGVFKGDRYFDISIEYAKDSNEDILIHIQVTNRSSDNKTLHLLPTLWFRNIWSWGYEVDKPRLVELFNILQHSSQFIATEPLGTSGEKGEQLVWEAIQIAFAERKCLGYWRYPIFSATNKLRKEPDILIADYQLGLIVIEVKAIAIEQIVSIQGHRWQYQNFYTSYGNPYQQAENQLFSLLTYTDKEPLLQHQITARVLIALPSISQQQWQAKGFHQLPSNPPILFAEHLRSQALYSIIAQTIPVVAGKQLTSTQWQLLLGVLGGTPVLLPPARRRLAPSQSRGSILKQARSRLTQLDLQQEKIAKQIPPGAQRIRGIAGSGKTVLLCQKAVQMHLKHPDWQIAVVFFSRSLYGVIIEQIERWISYFTVNSQRYQPQNSSLQVLHAWGGKQQAGFYSSLCNLTRTPALTVGDTQSQQPNEALGEVCTQLLASTVIPQVFDAVLIDEGQDLVVNDWQYQHKQPFYWLAYQSLRPVDPVHPQQRRLIWTCDEAQSLANLNSPTASDLLGEELGHLVTGQYANGINKTEVMYRCYRTPHQILTLAHAIGMGWLRPEGLLTGMTCVEDWQAIGYEIKGSLKLGAQIILKRPRYNSPNPITELWQGEVIDFNLYSSRQQELTALANQIKHNLRFDGLRPSREILVIVLGNHWTANQLANRVAKFLINQGIEVYLPSKSRSNLLQTETNQDQPNQFWYEGAVTIATVHRAKGQEAEMVYLVGLDRIAQAQSNILCRNQLFVALTRAKGWVTISGIGNYPFYREMQQVIKSGDTFQFTYKNPPQRIMHLTEPGELLTRYALGERNFRGVDLQAANLTSICLNHVSLIGANLQGANLFNAQLQEAKLIVADLSHANLARANLRKAKLMGANLREANLSQADLTGADLSNAELQAANLEETKLTDANLHGINW